MTQGLQPISDAKRIATRAHTLALEGQQTADPATPPPAWLSDLAQQQWRTLLPLLALASIDLTLLEIYCETYANMRASLDAVRTEGPTLLDGKGKQYTNPACGQARQAAEALRKIGASLGISPAARGRIKVPPKPSAQKTGLAALWEE